jgi:glutathione S-transferase
MFKLYGFSGSGNCYKVSLLLTQLQQSFEWIEIDILQRESRTPEFLAKNPNGKIPTLELAPGKFLWESNAILYFLSTNTALLPDDLWLRSQVLQWLFFEQYSHEPYIATSRFLIRYLKGAEEYQDILAAKLPRGYEALDVMENHLNQHSFFVAERYTIADIALYAYTHVAEEGGFDLSKYKAIQAWFDRVESQPNYISIE